MALAIVYSRALVGIDAPLVTVETHVANGLPGFFIVGLPETAVKESRDRVRSALQHAGFEFPIKRITVNLAPADLPKEGGRFDLPIALGVLAASCQIPKTALAQYEFIGELALSGELRSVRGILPAALQVLSAKRSIILPEFNAAEASLVKTLTIYPAKHLLDVCAHITKGETLQPLTLKEEIAEYSSAMDISDVEGQVYAKRALVIAAAGNHSLLFVGPPGTGKTMLASRLPTILPSLSESEALETAAIYSLTQQGFDVQNWRRVPFRAPHHSCSNPALVGGGRPPRPGEISLAHRGVLFLDELPEFNRSVLESLREPLESGAVTISRAAHQAVFPARFQLIAAMNPCPCGYAGSQSDCNCTALQIRRYLNKLSGPLLDRIDMHVEVPALPPETFLQKKSGIKESLQFKSLILKSREIQQERQGKLNSVLSTKEIKHICFLNAKPEHLLMRAMTQFRFSARVYYRIIKVAQTIADLANSAAIEEAHIAEALGFRYLDRLTSFKSSQFDQNI